MKKQEMCERLALARGWQWYSFRHQDQDESFPRCVGLGKGKGDFHVLSPDGHYTEYRVDAAAVKQAEERLPVDKRDAYVNCLLRLCSSENRSNFITITLAQGWLLLEATLWQRAEAICRTLWPEDFE
jgi:hypothetical protein